MLKKRKKLIIGIGVFLISITAVWVMLAVVFPISLIEGIEYDTRALQMANRQRISMYHILLYAFQDNVKALLDRQADYLFWDVVNNIDSDAEHSILYSNERLVDIHRISKNILTEHYRQAAEIDARFYASMHLYRTSSFFPLQYRRSRQINDIFPPLISFIEYDNAYYDRNAMQILVEYTETMNNNINNNVTYVINMIFDEIYKSYMDINAYASNPPVSSFYSHYLSEYLRKIGRTADESIEHFFFMASGFIVDDISDFNAAIIRKPIVFSPVRLNAYFINGNYYHASSLNKMNEYLRFLANDWERYNRDTIARFIALLSSNNTSILYPVINSAGFQYYRDALSGVYQGFYYQQCIVAGAQSITVNSSAGLDLPNMGSLPLPLVKMHESYYNYFAVVALQKSLEIASAQMIQNSKNLLEQGVIRQDRVILENINDYLDWYFSDFTGIERTFTNIVSIFTGERTARERFYTDNFNRIINRNADIMEITSNDMYDFMDVVFGIIDEYTELLEYFAINAENRISHSLITGDDIIQPFINSISDYFDLVYSLLENANVFLFQDFTTDRDTGGSALRQNIVNRITENRENKMAIINDPFNFSFNLLQIGSLIYVDNYFAGLSAYQHYGVYIGNGRVVHFAPLEGYEINFENGIIHETELEKFLQGRALRIDFSAGMVFPQEEILHRALSRIGEKGYDLLSNNCEHFARWCVSGESVSYQILNMPDRVESAVLFFRDSYNAVSGFIERFR